MSDTLAPTHRFPFVQPNGDPLVPVPSPGSERVARITLPTGREAWLVSHHDDVRQLLRSPDFSSDFSHPLFPLLREAPLLDESRRAGFFIGMDAPDHTMFRRFLTPEFMIKAMRRLEPLIRETVVESIESMRAAGSPADLVEWFALPVPSMIICHLLGVPYSDHAFFQQRSRTLLNRKSSMPELRAAGDELRGYLADLVAVKQRDGGTDDLLGRLAVERVATGEITAQELVGISVLLLVAGHETTANMIGLGTLVLLRHPDQLAQLRERPELIDGAVEELLRYLTIVRTGLPRLAVADTEIGGQVIRAGEGAIALLSAANRDPEAFARPDEFDLHRAAHSHMAFGFGVHQCIGQPLARSELRIAFAELTTRLPGLALAGDQTDLVFRDSTVFGVERLPVTW
ncbi:cytochrome P450 [Allocatelliglobosispora scoriae]|uniref:Cytochrome P450 n=1 Tax=Allocatelliglobosispora scoriae TaxID=643052 RepID=A0A841C0G2_9ACTN|nr:cytochrome P450 [Allocatelliglobosispora scoriae]MBB5873346.1 cytochrome P450 [Allocatelliglobosispora scoriae]